MAERLRMERFYLCKVVWYDGCEAYVGKFILETEEQYDEGECNPVVTERAKAKLNNYMVGCEVLKIDTLYAVSLDNIIAFSKLENSAEEHAAYKRFNDMYFRI